MLDVATARRGVEIALALAWVPLAFVARLFTAEVPPDRTTREAWWGELLGSALERLGASFVKFGQILGSRPDLLPPGMLASLARLQDRVAPIPFARVEEVLREEWAGLRSEVELETTPIAAASVAQVHRGRLADGTVVAVKVQRPLAKAQVERDLRWMRLVVGWIDRIPTVHLLSLPGALDRFGEALSAQLDFRVEAANNARFQRNFRRVRGVAFPRIYERFSGERVLTMDFVDGVKATDPAALGVGLEPEAFAARRRELAERGGRAILKMVFEDGFVHADLHPGNILLGSDGTMTFLDLGLCTEIPPEFMRPWADTFSALAQQDGARAAELFYGYAPTQAVEDYDAYERDVMGFLEHLYGAMLGDVEVSVAIGGMMNVLRKHQVQVDPVFTVVDVALLVAEGLGKQLDPSVDLILLAVPYLLQAQLTAPEGVPPRRAIPHRARD